MTIKNHALDPLGQLDTPEGQDAHIEAACGQGDVDLILAALGDIARARGMSAIAESAKVSREVIYKSFSKGGNPRLATLSQVAGALGYKLTLRRQAKI